MGLFKKLQENSLYWRYRFITRRYLELRRWWRTRGQPRGNIGAGARYRATAAYNPSVRATGLSDPRRGIAFVLAVAAAWTALSLAAIPQDGLLMGVLRIGTLAAITTAFVRFW